MNPVVDASQSYIDDANRKLMSKLRKLDSEAKQLNATNAALDLSQDLLSRDLKVIRNLITGQGGECAITPLKASAFNYATPESYARSINVEISTALFTDWTVLVHIDPKKSKVANINEGELSNTLITTHSFPFDNKKL